MFLLPLCAAGADHSPSLNIQQADLVESDAQQYSFAGNSVAISGNTVVVGAPGYNDGQGNYVPGVAYVFVEPAGGWTNLVETAELTASDGASKPGGNFGLSVAIAGDTVVVGAPNLLLGTFPDKAYVFVKPPGGWQDMTETAILSGSSASATYGFGASLAIDASADTILVGSVYGQVGVNIAQGTVSVFLKPSGGWTTTSMPQAVLVASDGGANARLGGSVAIDHDTVVAGANGDPFPQAPGSVYVFVKPAGGWRNETQTAKLTASNPADFAMLGTSVAILNNTIVTGAPGVGAGYIFTEPAGGWKNATENAVITAFNTPGNSLGQSVALNNDGIAVGAPTDTVNGNLGQGSVYVFVKPKGGWRSTSHPAKELTAQYGVANDNLGVSVAIGNDAVVTGAPESFDGGDSGIAYVFFVP